MQIEFRALVKKVTSKALVSLDKSYQVVFEGEDKEIGKLIDAPADETVIVSVKYGE